MREIFLTERYKYIIDQKKRLNETTFKIAAFYQAVMLVILGAQFKVIESAQRAEITKELARIASWGLFWATFALTLVSILILAGGVAAWFDYRKDEAELELQVLGASRPPASLRGIFRWHETYIALTMVGTVAAYWIVLKIVLLPLLVERNASMAANLLRLFK